MAKDAPTIDYRSLLDQERSELLSELAELGFADGKTGLDYDPNFADSSQVTAERGEAEALAVKLRATLGEVEAAIDRLDRGAYGLCEVCGTTIEAARLEAKPAARLCITCAARS